MTHFQSLEKCTRRISNHWKFLPTALFIATSAAFAADAGSNSLRVISGPLKRVGSVELDAATKTVVATGFVETVSGVLDYLAVGMTGKRYESVLTLELNAVDLQTALLLCGAKAGEPMKARDEGPPRGSPLNIWVEWTADGAKKTVAAEELIWNHRENKPVKTDWIFTGSVVANGHFGAADEDCFVATRWDPYAIVNIGGEIGKTYEDVYVNTNTVPATNTPVRVYFQAR
jgi:hypothetical protein